MSNQEGKGCMLDNTIRREFRDVPADVGPISWWSWRPGIKPLNALLLGCPLTIFALLMILLGLITLVAGIEDSSSAPLLVPGTVISRSTGTTTSASQLTIHLRRTAGFPSTVALAVPAIVAQHVPINATVTLMYSQRLHFAYALEYAGHPYILPGVSAAGNPVGSIALLLLGLIMLPYPALLAHWGWRDLLIERYDRGRLCKMMACIVDTRAMTRTHVARPGFAGRGTRPWYGIALLPVEGGSSRHVYTFSVSGETHGSVQKGTLVNATYAPHLHYVYRLVSIPSTEMQYTDQNRKSQ